MNISPELNNSNWLRDELHLNADLMRQPGYAEQQESLFLDKMIWDAKQKYNKDYVFAERLYFAHADARSIIVMVIKIKPKENNN